MQILPKPFIAFMTCYARMLADDSMEGTLSHGLARDCVTIFI